MTLIADVFLNLRTLKHVVIKMSKGLVPENRSRKNMVNVAKHYSKLNDSTFTIFIDPCELNSGWKSLFEWYRTFYERLLTHWLLITNILLLIETIYSNIFRCNYLRNEKCLFNFFLSFVNLHSILSIFKKRMTLIADVFLNLPTLKDVVR